MAVAPASMADQIILLDDDDDVEKTPQPLAPVTKSSSQKNVKKISPLKALQATPTHIAQSPFASSKKEVHIVKVENEKLFSEFVEYCTSLTQDCPEVITFLKTKHAKASPSFLTSVEFRNILGRCLTRAQTNRSKTFVYINELCTVLRQHGIKKRQTLNDSTASESVSLDQPKIKNKAETNAAEVDEQPSTSGVNEDPDTDRKAARKTRKQIAYLENLLKVYNEEIRRLQEADLSLDDLGKEDSLYIQEHKLKRKMMKIYEKLCEIKGCGTLTGRVLEQRIDYRGSRYPEINKRIEKFINSSEARIDAPDYHDILQVVLRANDRHNLSLSRKQLNEIAKEAFRETASRIQDRRHLDLVYNFGSHLTDSYKPAADPALSDSSLLKKLRSNREVAIDRLEEVITKYSSKQEDTEEQERVKRAEKDKSSKGGNASKNIQEAEANGVEDEEEDDEDYDDQSSDPDIEEEIEASTRLDATEGASEDETNEAEQAIIDEEDKDQMPLSGSGSERDEGDPSDLSPLSQQSKSLLTPLSNAASSPPDSPSQSLLGNEEHNLSNGREDNQPPLSNRTVGEQCPLSNGSVAESSTNLQQEVSTLTKGKQTKDSVTVTQNGLTSESPAVVEKCGTSSSTTPIDTPRTTRAQKRRREEMSTKPKHTITSDTDIPLDMGVCDSPPRKTRPETPPHVSSSQSTPPPKKNKVNVATQCDPQEVIVLSDSE